MNSAVGQVSSPNSGGRFGLPRNVGRPCLALVSAYRPAVIMYKPVIMAVIRARRLAMALIRRSFKGHTARSMIDCDRRIMGMRRIRFIGFDRPVVVVNQPIVKPVRVVRRTDHSIGGVQRAETHHRMFLRVKVAE